MALEALKQYAQDQKQVTQAEIEKLVKKDALKCPTSHEKAKGGINPLISKENVTEALQERLAVGYREQQENIRRAKQLRADINKGVQAGEPIYRLLLTAIECISLMTGEKLFYDMNKENLQTIYGILGEIEIERQEVYQRLNNLKAAYEREEAADAKRRIQNAIKAHEDKLNKLQCVCD